jgi:hypothetical protein
MKIDSIGNELSVGDVAVVVGYGILLYGVVKKVSDSDATCCTLTTLTFSRMLDKNPCYKTRTKVCHYESRILKLNDQMCAGFTNTKFMEKLQELRRMILMGQKIPNVLL